MSLYMFTDTHGKPRTKKKEREREREREKEALGIWHSTGDQES